MLVCVGIVGLIYGLYKYTVWASRARSIDTLQRAGVPEEEAKRIVREHYRANGL